MPKSQFAHIYRNVPVLLREMRNRAGLTQRELAVRIRKSQSWVFKSECGSRRVDVAEFMEWCIGCGENPRNAFDELHEKR